MDRVALKDDLDPILRHAALVFWVCAAMAIALFVAVVALSFLHLDSPVLIQVIQAVCGVSASGLIYRMFMLWRTRLYTEILISLATNGSEDALRNLLIITKKFLLKD